MTAPARPAATVCVVRDGDGGPEVLMVRRRSDTRFMAGAWVFPGGVVDSSDRGHGGNATDPPSDGAFCRAALRELAEEAGIWIVAGNGFELPSPLLKGESIYDYLAAAGAGFDTDRLAYFANWITPTMIPLRFDTRFYAVELRGDPSPVIDEEELDAFEWVVPSAMLTAAVRGERILAIPTRHVLALIGRFAASRDFMDHAGALDEIAPVQARGRVRDDGSIEVVLPGEDGFEDLAEDDDVQEALSEGARLLLREGHLAEVVVDEG